MAKHIRYILMAINRPAYDEVVMICGTEFRNVYPDNILSVNENEAGSRALIKVVSDNLDWIDSLPIPPQQIFENAPTSLVNNSQWRKDPG